MDSRNDFCGWHIHLFSKLANGIISDRIMKMIEERRDITVSGLHRRTWYFYDQIYAQKLQSAIAYLGSKWVGIPK